MDLIELWRADPVAAERVAASLRADSATDSGLLSEAAAILCASTAHLDHALALARQAHMSAPDSTIARFVEACVYYARGDAEYTIHLVDGLLQTDPDSVPILLLAARVQQRLGHASESLRFLQRAADNAPGDKYLVFLLARQTATAGLLSEATELFESLLSSLEENNALVPTRVHRPSEAPLFLDDASVVRRSQVYEGLGRALVSRQRFNEARHAFVCAQDEDSTSLVAQWGLAVVDLATGHSSAARRSFDRVEALALSRRNCAMAVNAALRAAECLEDLGESDSALLEYRRIYSQYSDVLSAPIKSKIGDLLSSRIAVRSPNVPTLNLKMVEAERADGCLVSAINSMLAYQEVQEHLDGAASSGPDAAGHAIGDCIEAVRRIPGVDVSCFMWDARLAQTLLSVSVPFILEVPVLGGTWYTKHAYAVVGLDISSQSVLVRDPVSFNVVRVLPLTAVVHHRMIVILPRSLGHLLDTAPATDNVCTPWISGELQMQGGAFDPAICYFRKALEIDPSIGELWLRLADALFQNRQLDLAVGAYTEACTRSANDVPILCMAGVQLIQCGATVQGLSALMSVLALEPSHHIALVEMAFCYLELGRLNDAFEVIDKLTVCSSTSQDQSLLVSIRSLFRTTTDVGALISEMRGSAVDGARACVWLFLARAYAMTSDFAAALQCVDRFATSARSDSERSAADRARREIRDGVVPSCTLDNS